MALAILVLFPDVLFLGHGFYIRDVYRDYLPSRFVLRSIVANGEFPSWNRFYSGGQPLAANPGFQAFYPGTWLVFLPSFLLGFNLEIVLHIAFAAAGMFLLLRSMELRTESALFGAIAFGLGGATLSLTNLLPFLTSVAWWPWIVTFVRQRRWGLFAIALGMLLLAAEQSAIVQTALLLLCVVDWRRDWRKVAIASVLAVGIGAIALIPAFDLKGDSGRANGVSYEDATAWSMPIVRPAELFYPAAFGRITNDGSQYRGASRYRPPRLPLIFSIYCGLLVPLFAIAGVAMKLARWTWIAVPLSYLLAIGSNGPLIPLLYRIGIYRSMRYPEKFILFGLFALIVLAATAFDRVDRRFAPLLLLIAFGDVALHINELAPRMPPRFFTRPPVTLALTGPNRIFHEAAWPVWGTKGPQLEGGDRTYWSQRTALMPFTPALYGLETIYELDINVTNLRPTSDLVQSIWEARAHGAPLRPFMMMANADYLVLPGRPIRIAHGSTQPRYWFADQIVPIHSREDFMRDVTTNRRSDRAAWIADELLVPARGRVLLARETSHSATLNVQTDGPALLVASVTPHRYWRAAIDGRPARLTTVNIGFQGLIVPAGAHAIDLQYFNPLFPICAAISFISLLLSIIVMIYHDDNGGDQTLSNLL